MKVGGPTAEEEKRSVLPPSSAIWHDGHVRRCLAHFRDGARASSGLDTSNIKGPSSAATEAGVSKRGCGMVVRETARDVLGDCPS
jgi:hypothetical protein